MTKADIIDEVHERLVAYSRNEAAQIVEIALETIKDTLARGESIKVPGFGNFGVHHKRERTGRNPRTGEVVTITARRILTFKASDVLKAALNP